MNIRAQQPGLPSATGFPQEASSLTSGHIPHRFSEAIQFLPATDSRIGHLQALVQGFRDLVKDRNRLMHGHPHAANTDDSTCYVVDGMA